MRALEVEDEIQIVRETAGKAFVCFKPLHVLLSACTGVAMGVPIPSGVPLPAAPSVQHGKALKHHKPAQFRRDLRKEALLTSSDSGEDCTGGSGEECAAGAAGASSKKLVDQHISELDPRLRISTSKVRYIPLPTWVIPTLFVMQSPGPPRHRHHPAWVTRRKSQVTCILSSS